VASKAGGAGDQGIMFGYASNATEEYMPLPILYAHKLVKRLADIRKNEPSLMPYLRPDSKSQVTFEYEDRQAIRVHTIVVSTQHDSDVTQRQIRRDVEEPCDRSRLPAGTAHGQSQAACQSDGPLRDRRTPRRFGVDRTQDHRRYLWRLGPHGGGAFSGKDPSKVDRSAAYATRHLAKNIVAAGVADECTIQIGYAIGVAKPVSIHIETHGSAHNGVTDRDISRWVQRNVDMTPNGIIERLKLRRPIYRDTAAYGHFGRNGSNFTWEKLDMVKDIRKALA
jgi:S-adenosylmethionine synthetase